MGQFIDLTGERFGRLTITTRAPNRSNRVRWFYICDCGTEGDVSANDVRNNGQVSCGCLQREVAAQIGRNNVVHGHSRRDGISPTYASWTAMKDRVLTKTHHAWPRYGGRGISICDRWVSGADGKSGFECFLLDMGDRPDGHTLDRIDSNGDYEPSNCRWATPELQARNSYHNKLSPIEAGVLRAEVANDNLSIPNAAKRFGVSRSHAWKVVNGQRWAA